MKVLYVASEAVPFAKTGGLADVAGSLPKALKAEGVDVRLLGLGHQDGRCEKDGKEDSFHGVCGFRCCSLHWSGVQP